MSVEIGERLKGQLDDLESYDEALKELEEEEKKDRQYAPGSDQDVITALVRQSRIIQRTISSLSKFVEKDVQIMRDIDRATYGLLNAR